MNVAINKKSLFPYLIYNKPYKYNDAITLYPIKMKDIVIFQRLQSSIMLYKDAIFHEKKLIKMDYWDFIKYANKNYELSEDYNLPLLPYYYDFVLGLFELSCGDDVKIEIDTNLEVYINEFKITNEVFDDLRRIILIQNDIDFDIDEFMNIDTLQALEKAREFEAKKKKEKADIEDYIDSLIIGLKVTEEYVSNLTIRKFWRYINRLNKHDEYQACRSGQMTGFVTFKEPLKHWMTSFEVDDKYENLKTNEQELRSKIE